MSTRARYAVFSSFTGHATAMLVAVAVAISAMALDVPLAVAAGGGGGHGGGHGGDSAASAGNRPDRENVRPRDQAHLVGGTYMQINPLWLPVFKGNRSRYQAITARLVPLPDRRVEACYKAPWAQEAILFELTERPLPLSSLEDLARDKALKARLLQRIHQHIGETNYEDVILLSGLHEPDPTEMDLTFMCH